MKIVWAIILVLFHCGLTADEFKLKWVIEQENIWQTAATTNDGKFLALSYRIPDLGGQTDSKICCISVWNMENGELDRRIEKACINPIRHINTPTQLFDSGWPNQHYITRDNIIYLSIKASKAEIKANYPTNRNLRKNICIYHNEEMIREFAITQPNTLMQLSPYGQFLVIITENEIEVIDIAIGNTFQKIPTLTEKFGSPAIVFFFEYQEVLHLSVVYANHARIWCICKQSTKSARNILPTPEVFEDF